jgi:hypothetical protein
LRVSQAHHCGVYQGRASVGAEDRDVPPNCKVLAIAAAHICHYGTRWQLYDEPFYFWPDRKPAAITICSTETIGAAFVSSSAINTGREAQCQIASEQTFLNQRSKHNRAFISFDAQDMLPLCIDR